MKFSLVTTTSGREKEIKNLLESLVQQTYKNFELIMVDQNKDDRVEKILDIYQSKIPSLRHVKADFRGASRGRNEGVKYATGDIVAFPDDDCEYASNVLEKVHGIFLKNDIDILTVKHVSEWPESHSSLAKLVQLNRYSIWLEGIEFVVFLKRPAFEAIGLFDEMLGVGCGTPSGSGEGTDYWLRAMTKGYKIMHCPFIYIKHPKAQFEKTEEYKKAFRYSVGRRYVLDRYHYPCWFILVNIGYPLVKLLLNFYQPKKVKYFWYQFLGRLKCMRGKII